MPKLTLARTDITTLTVDAIVNAANRYLRGGSGVDGAIHRAAGPKLLDECLQIPETPPGSGIRCPTGQARITRAHDLPARHVIHTVGPVWSDDPECDDPLLASCYRESLRLASAHACRTIAFPAISCGVYGYPIERACGIAVRTIRAELEKLDAIKQVMLVAFDDEIAEAYQELLGRKR